MECLNIYNDIYNENVLQNVGFIILWTISLKLILSLILQRTGEIPNDKKIDELYYG